MAASSIAISSDSSDESVGSPPSRVILFGDIPTVISSTSVVALEISIIAPVISSAALVVETTLVASPTGLWLAISPFLCTDSSEAPDSSDGPPSQDPYVATVARWRSRVTASPSSSSEFPIALVTAQPRIRRRSAILIRPGEAIPFGRPYRTHLNGPRKLLTTRKRVGPLPARRLAWRHASPRSSDHHPSSSSSPSDSSPVHSLGLDASDQAHSGSSTRDVPPRLCYPPRRAPRRSEAFHHWCATPLSTFYEIISSYCADLLPPRKRFRDSYSSKASIEEDTEIDPIETEVDMELGIGDGNDVRDHVEIYPRDVRDDKEEYEADTSAGDTVEVGIGPMSAPIVKEEIVEPAGEDPSDSSGTRDGIVRSFEDMPINLDDDVRDFYHHMSEKTIKTDAAYALSWRDLLKLMTEVYYLRNEIQKMETELWNLSVKKNDMATYTQRFQELTMMCTKMVPEEEDRVDKFIGGLPDNIQGNGYAVRNTENKRRLNNNYRNNRGQQPPHKRQNTGGQNVARAYMASNNEKNGYEGTLPFCNKWRNQGVIMCFECGAQGHYRKDCPKVKNQNRKNKARVPDARGKAYILGGGANRSFISNTFSALLDIIPYALDVSYAVELADGRTSETNTVLRGCTLGLLGHPFNINLMPIDLSSFDVIIGMDWIAKNHAVITCAEKIVRIPYGNEILIVQGDKSNNEKKSTLSIISC
ncbi:putative reverse transcriptase domain-containing protein, partial [Tanacetum coccineum]